MAAAPRAVQGSVAETAHGLGPDAAAYRRLLGPLVRDAELIVPTVLAPLRSVPGTRWQWPGSASAAVAPASWLARRFSTDEGRALLAGVAAHAIRPLEAPLTGGFGLLLTMLAHSVGWPVVEGGSVRLIEALTAELEALGGQDHHRPLDLGARRPAVRPGDPAGRHAPPAGHAGG